MELLQIFLEPVVQEKHIWPCKSPLILYKMVELYYFKILRENLDQKECLKLLKLVILETSLLENVKVGRVTNTGEQIQYLSKIKEMDNFSLIIIDNVTDLFSFEYSKELQVLEKSILFMRYMHDLSLIAIQKRIPIVITNMIRKIDKTEKENLDKSISLFTHLKINLMKKDAKYFGEILPSFQGKRLFSYLITKEGLVDAS